MVLNSEPVSVDFGLLLLRAGAAIPMFWQHGWHKVTHFGEMMDRFSDPIGLGPAISLGLVTFAETACAALVALGLWTRLATVPVVIAMGVAAFMAHGDSPFNKQEPALLYLIAFATIFFTGSGRFSLHRLSFQ